MPVELMTCGSILEKRILLVLDEWNDIKHEQNFSLCHWNCKQLVFKLS